MSIDISIEPARIVADDPLFLTIVSGYEAEAAVMPAHPDIDAYIEAEVSGFVTVFAARENGVLVGFAVLAHIPNRQYGSMQAIVDCVYALKEYRERCGARLLTTIARVAKAKGAQKLFLSAKVGSPLYDSLVGKHGFTHETSTFSMEI